MHNGVYRTSGYHPQPRHTSVGSTHDMADLEAMLGAAQDSTMTSPFAQRSIAKTQHPSAESDVYMAAAPFCRRCDSWTLHSTSVGRHTSVSGCLVSGRAFLPEWDVPTLEPSVLL